MKSLIFLSILLTSFFTQASVWDAEPGKEWNEVWQQKYSEWIQTEVGPDFFKKLEGPFKDLRIDCADAHYALIAYFARENGLPVKTGWEELTNERTAYDHILDDDERMVAFLEELADRYGTESIAHKDSYPVAVENVRAGDLFMYKVGTENFTRHTYIIKNINIDGTFDVLYSTQNRKEKGWPLNRYKKYMFKKAPLNTGNDTNSWGFRRGKIPQQMGISQRSLVKSGVGSFSQYELANKLGRLGFFREVKRINQKIEESPKMIVGRNFDTVCKAVQDRVVAVQSGIDYMKEKVQAEGRQCMDFQEFDAYSTPSRDSGIIDDFNNYIYDLRQIISKGQQTQVGPLYGLSGAIFKRQDLTDKQLDQVIEACPIKVSIGTVDLSNFRKKLFAKKVSFNPNDNIYYRWGIQHGHKTRCEEFYGYPH